MDVRQVKFFRWIVFVMLVAYLVAISIFTVYSQTGYIANLPGVSLTRPARQEIPYELHSQATVQEGQLVCHIPFGSGVPGAGSRFKRR